MNTAAAPQIQSTLRRSVRVGSVSYLNAKPLIYGLSDDPHIDLRLAVPAMLLDGMRCGELDIALLPTIDFQRLQNARLLPSGGIGCDGPTLTVRIFSRKPIHQIAVLACDAESHTSVALARIILAEQFGTYPRLVDWGSDAAQADASLLIGDKVVTHEPHGYPHQLDLGSAWKSLTGKPFVFAVWTTRDRIDLGDLPIRLERARTLGIGHLADIVAAHAKPHGWPADLAMKYLSQNLKFEIGPAQLDAIGLFHQLAAKHGIIPQLHPLISYCPPAGR